MKITKKIKRETFDNTIPKDVSNTPYDVEDSKDNDSEYITNTPTANMIPDSIMNEANEENEMDPNDPNAMAIDGQMIDPNDPNAAMGDPNMLGAGGMMPVDPDLPTSMSEVGKAYELKKIHTRLIVLDRFLSQHQTEKSDSIQIYLRQALDLFHVVISNFRLYINKIDDLIVLFYKFIFKIVEMIKQIISIQREE